MSIASKKQWSCMNQCKSNCCSFVFLPINETQEKEFNLSRSFVVKSKYSDWKWMSYHNNIIITKLEDGKRRITIKDEVKIEFKNNSFSNQRFIYFEEDCSKLLPSGRCKVYRTRPQLCRVTRCPVYEKDKLILWFGQNSKLKHLVKL